MPSNSPTPAGGPRDVADTPHGPTGPRDPSAAPRAATAHPAEPVPVSAPSPERADPIDPNPSPALRDRAPAASPGPTRPGYRAVFAVREFRAVFAAHLLSLLGVVVSELALTVLVYDLTGSPCSAPSRSRSASCRTSSAARSSPGSPTATRPAGFSSPAI